MFGGFSKSEDVRLVDCNIIHHSLTNLEACEEREKRINS